MNDAPESGADAGHRVTPVSRDDLARVVNRALSERSGMRIRLTAGQRMAILNRRLRPGPARA
jgi:uncharacterized protein YbjT (DUF2867 family)